MFTRGRSAIALRTRVAAFALKALFPPHVWPGRLDETTAAVVDRSDGSNSVYRLDLRSPAATCCGAEGSAWRSIVGSGIFRYYRRATAPLLSHRQKGPADWVSGDTRRHTDCKRALLGRRRIVWRNDRFLGLGRGGGDGAERVRQVAGIVGKSLKRGLRVLIHGANSGYQAGI
jgi:hypothetical protein